MTQKFIKKQVCDKHNFSILLLSMLFISCSLKSNSQPNDAKEFFSTLSMAESKMQNKDWSDAAILWGQLAETNPVNGKFWLNEATSYYNNANYDKAIPAYLKTYELNYGIVPNVLYNIACCYALSGNKQLAIDYLQKAFEKGFANVANAQTDKDLLSLHDNPVFKKMTGFDDVTKMGRIEGWHYDLAFLQKEVHRKAYLSRNLDLSKFDLQLQEIYTLAEKKTDMQLDLELVKLMTQLGDGHSAVERINNELLKVALPVAFYFFKEGLYITAAQAPYKDIIGKKVILFAGKTPVQIMEAFKPYVSRDNEMGLLNNTPYFLRNATALYVLGLLPEANKVNLQLADKNGNVSNVIVTSEKIQPVRPDIFNLLPPDWINFSTVSGIKPPLYLKNTGSNYWFETITGTKTIYFQFNKILNDKEESLNQFTDRLMQEVNSNKTENLIIDLRGNNGGNTMLLPYLTTSIFHNQKLNQKGRLFVIIGRKTFSAAQNFATFLERWTPAIFVGEPTGSSPNFVGEEIFLILPYSKVTINVSNLFWQSSWPQDQRKWIAPLIYTTFV